LLVVFVFVVVSHRITSHNVPSALQKLKLPTNSTIFIFLPLTTIISSGIHNINKAFPLPFGIFGSSH
jgi:hypothetical protein